VRDWITDELSVCYEQRAPRAGRPFLDVQQAREPSWFSPDEFGGWGALPGKASSVRTATRQQCFAVYQRVLHALREQYVKSDDPWLAPVVWMIADPALSPYPAARVPETDTCSPGLPI
jgi:hypothetical protein